MSVLLRHPQWMLADHQIPTHRGMAGTVGFSISEVAHLRERSSPTNIWILKVAYRLSGLLEEQQVMIDLAGELESSSQCELPPQYSQRPRAELDEPILTGLGRVLVESSDARLVDS